MQQDFTAIILSGGKSSRMGENKAFLSVSEKTTIERIVDVCKEAAKEVLIVTNDRDRYRYLNVTLVEDTVKEFGPLAGLEAGISAASFERTFITACDMPFIESHLLQTLVDRLEDCDAAVPKIQGIIHPLFAAYRKTCLGPIRRKIAENKRRIVSFYDDVNVQYIQEEELHLLGIPIENALFNMNTPEEYENAKLIAKGIASDRKGVFGKE